MKLISSIVRLFVADAPKSCSSLSDGESFECYGESELADNNTIGGGSDGIRHQLHAGNSLSRLSVSQSMMSGGSQLSPVSIGNGGVGGGGDGGNNSSSSSTGGDPELSSSNNNANNG